MAAPASLAAPKPRTVFYIDGLNLYYGAIRPTPAHNGSTSLDTAGFSVLMTT
jgi:hypothetical protein